MTGRDLKALRIKLFGDRRGAIKKAAQSIEINYRSYQRHESNSGSIPGPVSVAMRGLETIQELNQQVAVLIGKNREE